MLSALTGATFVAATLCDIRARQIPNTLPLLVVAFGFAQGLIDGGLASAVAIAAAFFALGLLGYRFGLIGGGDAKLLAAAGFWVPPAALHDFFTVMALTGAVLALVVVARRRLVAAVTGEAAADAASVPYGAAIAAGAGYVLLAPV